jgi:uncharacterized protein
MAALRTANSIEKPCVKAKAGNTAGVKPDVAEVHRPAPPQPGGRGGAPVGPDDKAPVTGYQPTDGVLTPPPAEKRPTRLTGTVMISPERPARDIHQIVEAIIEQLTTLPGSVVKLKLEIVADVSSGLERAKVRTRWSRMLTRSAS